jgi:hypothetical protein
MGICTEPGYKIEATAASVLASWRRRAKVCMSCPKVNQGAAQMTMTRNLAHKGAVALLAVVSLTTMSESAYAWRGCWGCGGFAAGAIAGAALSRPYYAPRYYYGGPPAIVVAPPPVIVNPAPVYSYPYPTCPLVGPLPYYCR